MASQQFHLIADYLSIAEGARHHGLLSHSLG
jgi:hypothetical protein